MQSKGYTKFVGKYVTCPSVRYERWDLENYKS